MPSVSPLASRLLALCTALLILASSGCGTSTTTASVKSPSAPAKPKEPNPAIAVLYYNDGTPFCDAFREGVETAAKDREQTIKWYDASDGEEQSTAFDLAIEENHVAYCICPIAVDKLADRTTRLRDDGKPIVIAERPLTTEPLSEIDKQIAYVAADHFHHGGQIKRLALKQLGDEGTIFVVANDSFVAQERQMGIEYSLRDSTTVELVKSKEFWDADEPTEEAEEESDSDSDSEADDDDDEEDEHEEEEEEEEEEATESEPKPPYSIAESVTKYLKDNDPETVCIVALTIDDFAEVLKGKKAAGEDYADVPVYSFGVDPQTVKSLQSQELAATVLDDPYTMGLESVRALASGLEGEPVKGLRAPNEHIVTSDNLEDSRSEHLLRINVRVAEAAEMDQDVATVVDVDDAVVDVDDAVVDVDDTAVVDVDDTAVVDVDDTAVVDEATSP